MLYRYRQFSQGNSKDTLTLKFGQFAEIEVCIPSDPGEQEAIAAHFDSLDSLIALHQREQISLRPIGHSQPSP